jgi:protein TonB
MFEDSLVESTGRIRTRSKRLVVVSFFLQAAILAVLMLLPYLYPAALPKQAFQALLLAPPPPMTRANLPVHAAAASRAMPVMLNSLTLPSHIPVHAVMISDDNPEPAMSSVIGSPEGTTGGSNTLKNLFSDADGPMPRVVPEPKAKTGPMRVSAGVAAGRLLEQIRPRYPAIAVAARVQGTVVVEAVISKTGIVENAHAVSGPPMLMQAAVSAVAQARYQPYKLNGEPVEVETTVNVVFELQR